MNLRKISLLALVLCAAGLAAALHSVADSSSKAGDVTEARVSADASTGANWLLNGRTFDAIHAYVIYGAWKLYNGEKQSAHAKRENY